MEDLITIQTAKLAKEKGFNLTTTQMYGSQVKPQLEPYNETRYSIYRDYKLAPSQSVLQKWLREEHKIRVFVVNTAAGEFTYDTYVVNPIKENRIGRPWERSHCFEGFKTFEMALEKALQEGLKLIENNKKD